MPAMNAEQRYAGHALLDAAERVDHGQRTRKRLREAAVAYADAVRSSLDVPLSPVAAARLEEGLASARRGEVASWDDHKTKRGA